MENMVIKVTNSIVFLLLLLLPFSINNYKSGKRDRVGSWARVSQCWNSKGGGRSMVVSYR